MNNKFSEKQRSILEAAEKLIEKKGFEATSVRQICSEAGVNVAMVSYYFGSKEQMLTSLYQYRVQKTKETFAEFSETIKNGNPEMQMKELIKFIIAQMFHYKYFHGFVKQEFKSTQKLNDELQEFYASVVAKLDEVIKKGISTGVFEYAPKSEDLLSMLIGTVLFVIRNQQFYEKYIPNSTGENYLSQAEIKVRQNIYQAIFLQLGYQPEWN